MEQKTLEERLADDILTDNKALNHFAQCRDCIFRDKKIIGGKEYGYDKCVCRMFGRGTAERTNQTNPNFYPYVPVVIEDKPEGVYNNTVNCEFYEKEKVKK